MPLRRESRDFRTATFTQFLEQAGHITGIEDVGRERTLELIPTLAFLEAGSRVPAKTPSLGSTERFVNQPLKVDPGLTAKLSLSSGVTLDATLNPDFAEVETDQLVVSANQRLPIFYQEKRPFFLEGIDIFQTPINAVHTRTIVDPDFAAKLTGKRGRNTFALLVASDNAPGNFSEEEKNDPTIGPNIERFIDKNASVGVLRLKHDVGAQSSVGVIATSYSFVERHNQLVGIDGRFAVDSNTILSFQVLGTTTRRQFHDPVLDQNVYRAREGLAYFARVERNTRRVNASLMGRGYGPDYRADVGFTTQTNTNPWDLIVTYNSVPRENSRLISWAVASSTRAQFTWQARMQYAFQAWRAQFDFKKQTYLKADAYADYQRLLEEEYGPKRTAIRRGAFVAGPECSTIWKGYTIEAGTSDTLRANVSGQFLMGWTPNPGTAFYAGYNDDLNERAMEGYVTGQFPDGSVIVFDLLETRETAGSTVEEPRKFIDVMTKDSQRYAQTGGEFEEFTGDNQRDPVLTAQAKTECYRCHARQRSHDFVFSTFRR